MRVDVTELTVQWNHHVAGYATPTSSAMSDKSVTCSRLSRPGGMCGRIGACENLSTRDTEVGVAYLLTWMFIALSSRWRHLSMILSRISDLIPLSALCLYMYHYLFQIMLHFALYLSYLVYVIKIIIIIIALTSTL